jgi:hypothetical protein
MVAAMKDSSLRDRGTDMEFSVSDRATITKANSKRESLMDGGFNEIKLGELMKANGKMGKHMLYAPMKNCSDSKYLLFSIKKFCIQEVKYH